MIIWCPRISRLLNFTKYSTFFGRIAFFNYSLKIWKKKISRVDTCNDIKCKVSSFSILFLTKKSSCVSPGCHQEYQEIQLVAVALEDSGPGEVLVDTFLMPSCCTCHRA